MVVQSHVESSRTHNLSTSSVSRQVLLDFLRTSTQRAARSTPIRYLRITSERHSYKSCATRSFARYWYLYPVLVLTLQVLEYQVPVLPVVTCTCVRKDLRYKYKYLVQVYPGTSTRYYVPVLYSNTPTHC